MRLLARPKGAGAAVPYVLGIFLTYFAMGIVHISTQEAEPQFLEHYAPKNRAVRQCTKHLLAPTAATRKSPLRASYGRSTGGFASPER